MQSAGYGIRSFTWRYPLEAAEKLNTNVSLLSFEEIKEKIQNSIRLGFAQRAGKNVLGDGDFHIMVNKIVLTNVLVPIKNTPDYHMLVPAWLVYYQAMEMKESAYVFALNAIDGSSIDLSLHFSSKTSS